MGLKTVIFLISIVGSSIFVLGMELEGPVCFDSLNTPEARSDAFEAIQRILETKADKLTEEEREEIFHDIQAIVLAQASIEKKIEVAKLEETSKFKKNVCCLMQ